jgi:hypothetical protein
MSDEATHEGGKDAVRKANEREKDLDAETIFEDAEETFGKRSEGPPPLQPDDPPPGS